MGVFKSTNKLLLLPIYEISGMHTMALFCCVHYCFVFQTKYIRQKSQIASYHVREHLPYTLITNFCDLVF